MAFYASKARKLCSSFGYRKAREECERLVSFKPDHYDDNSRVTEFQWREMTKELLVLEENLADTKALLQRFYRAVTAPTMDFDEKS